MVPRESSPVDAQGGAMADGERDVVATEMLTGEEVMGIMADLRSPQETFRSFIERGGYPRPDESSMIRCDRENIDSVRPHHERFSPRVDWGPGNVRPLTPLNAAPPLHSKYRKLLDPLFAPK